MPKPQRLAHALATCRSRDLSWPQPAGLGMGCVKCSSQVLKQGVEATGQRLLPGDQNIVIARVPIKGKHGRSRGSEASFGAVSLDRSADLATCRETHPDLVFSGLAGRRRAGLERQSARAFAHSTGGPQEVRPDLQAADQRFRTLSAQAESFLRPCPRLRDRTLRPPLVAMRARKPCRRLRTILLGWYVRFIETCSGTAAKKSRVSKHATPFCQPDRLPPATSQRLRMPPLHPFLRRADRPPKPWK